MQRILQREPNFNRAALDEDWKVRAPPGHPMPAPRVQPMPLRVPARLPSRANAVPSPVQDANLRSPALVGPLPAAQAS